MIYRCNLKKLFSFGRELKAKRVIDGLQMNCLAWQDHHQMVDAMDRMSGEDGGCLGVTEAGSDAIASL